MNLHFESLDELHDMIREMGYVKADRGYTASVRPQTELDRACGNAPIVDIVYASDTTFGDAPGATIEERILNLEAEAIAELAIAEAGEQGNGPAPTAQPEPTKRKRRTKAEMEAIRAAENGQIADAAATVESSSTQATGAGSNPFEASTNNPSVATQAILNAPSGQAATLAGIQAMQNSPFAPTTEDTTAATTDTGAQNATAATTDAATYVETRSLEILSTQTEPLTAVKHMHLCRDFIAKHGQARYLEAFALAGLPATIGTYKPEQCAKHQAALEFLALV